MTGFLFIRINNKKEETYPIKLMMSFLRFSTLGLKIMTFRYFYYHHTTYHGRISRNLILLSRNRLTNFPNLNPVKALSNEKMSHGNLVDDQLSYRLVSMVEEVLSEDSLTLWCKSLLSEYPLIFFKIGTNPP